MNLWKRVYNSKSIEILEKRNGEPGEPGEQIICKVRQKRSRRYFYSIWTRKEGNSGVTSYERGTLAEKEWQSLLEDIEKRHGTAIAKTSYHSPAL